MIVKSDSKKRVYHGNDARDYTGASFSINDPSGQDSNSRSVFSIRTMMHKTLSSQNMH